MMWIEFWGDVVCNAVWCGVVVWSDLVRDEVESGRLASSGVW